MKQPRKPVYKRHVDINMPAKTRWNPQTKQSELVQGPHRLQAQLHLFVDWEKLMDVLGSKAIHSSGGKSRALKGAVEVRMVGVIRNAKES